MFTIDKEIQNSLYRLHIKTVTLIIAIRWST